MKHQHNRGKIKDNALKALVTSSLFKGKRFKAKKGKGSYSRKGRSNERSFGFYGLDRHVSGGM